MTNPCPIDRDTRQYAHREGVQEYLEQRFDDRINELTSEGHEHLACLTVKTFYYCDHAFTPVSFLEELIREDMTPEQLLNYLAARHVIDSCDCGSTRYELESIARARGYVQ